MNYIEGKKGWIEAIVGPMYSGKTEELIKRCKRMEYSGKKYQIFKPSIDTRYSTDEIVTHNKVHMPCQSVNHGSDIKRYIKDDTQAIVLDEIQFFDPSLIKALKELSEQGYRIIVAGLDTDFRGEPFGVASQILALADKVDKLTAICLCCGKEATRTQRIIDGKPAFYNDPTILVGEKESYQPRCRDCHIVLNNND
jgi:thymidine kinase